MFSLASIITMAACIFLVGVFYSIVNNVDNIAHKVEQEVPVTVFFNEGTTQEQIDAVENLIKVRPEVEKVEFESADDAWQKFKDITLPELKPLCVFVFITITIGAFRMIVQPMVMTGGGPSHSTYTMVYDIYETGTVNWEIGLASTMAIVFAIFVMILTIIQTILTKDKEEKKHADKKTKNN